MEVWRHQIANAPPIAAMTTSAVACRQQRPQTHGAAASDDLDLILWVGTRKTRRSLGPAP